jgi:hypothetical protein
MQRRTEGIAPCVLNFDTRWKSVMSFTLLPIYPRGTSPRYPLDRKRGGLQSRSGRGGEEKLFFHCPHHELNPGRPACSLVAALTAVNLRQDSRFRAVFEPRCDAGTSRIRSKVLFTQFRDTVTFTNVVFNTLFLSFEKCFRLWERVLTDAA